MLRRPGRKEIAVLAALALLQAILFYDYLAVSLTLLISLGIGLWLRHWSAALWALAPFLVGFAIASLSGWLGGARPLADLLIGAGLAFLGGLIGGGIFQLMREEARRHDARGESRPAPPRRTATSAGVRP